MADTATLLTAFAAVTDHASYWPAYVAVEQAMNTANLNGGFDEAEGIRVEMNRINRSLKPMLDAQYRAIPTYSLAELMERSAVLEAAK